MKINKKIRFWDLYRSFFGVPFQLYRRIEKSIILTSLKPISTDKVLDIGCGDGEFHEIISNKSSLFAIDINLLSLKYAKDRYNVSYLNADALHLPFKSEVFDKIFSNCVFEHLNDDNLVLQECNRVLKVDGTLILTVDCKREHLDMRFLGALLNKNLKNYYSRYGKEGLEKYLEQRYDIQRFYTYSDLRDKLENTNFKIINSSYYIKGCSGFIVDLSEALVLGSSSWLLNRLFTLLFPILYFIVKLNDNFSKETGYGLCCFAKKL